MVVNRIHVIHEALTNLIEMYMFYAINLNFFVGFYLEYSENQDLLGLSSITF